MQEREDAEEEDERNKKDLILGSYKRPKRPRPPDPIHPADERKL